jgi:hypothetical protein
MRLSLTAVTAAAVLLGPLLAVEHAFAQQARTGSVVDETLVPNGRVRLGLGTIFSSWDQRFGRFPDGSEGVEALGADLTDPTSLSLYPGMPLLQGAVRDLAGLPDYSPVLGSTDGRVTQQIKTIDFGVHLGVFDWLTVGAVLPWVETRTVIDEYFAPDSSANLGLSPMMTDAAAVDGFLSSTVVADAGAAQRAATICAAGPSAACSDAQALASRTSTFSSSIQGAYGATPFFPGTGTSSGDALQAEAADLSAALQAAGLGALPTLPLATDLLTPEGFAVLPSVVGSGIEASELQTRKALWGSGDLELSARVRLLDNLAPVWSPQETYLADRQAAQAGGPWLRYRLSASFLVRLPTGMNEDPDVLLDVGRSDAQMDFEGGATAELRFGRLVGLTMGGRYGAQGSTTLVKRVAPLDLAMPPLATRTTVTFDPGFYVVVGAAPTIHITDGLSVHAEYRFFHKGRDQFELVTPDPDLDPTVLEIDSGVKQHQAGAGLRYDTVSPWRGGAEGYPLEIHLRVLHSFDGSGGHAAKATRAEAGLRIFRRLWGPNR